MMMCASIVIALCLFKPEADNSLGVDSRHDDGIRIHISSVRFEKTQTTFVCRCDVLIKNRMESPIEITVPEFLNGLQANLRFWRAGTDEVFCLGRGYAPSLVSNPEVLTVNARSEISYAATIALPSASDRFMLIASNSIPGRNRDMSMKALPKGAMFAIDATFVVRYKSEGSQSLLRAAVGCENKCWLSND
jgi:hypothetical protein